MSLRRRLFVFRASRETEMWRKAPEFVTHAAAAQKTAGRRAEMLQRAAGYLLYL